MLATLDRHPAQLLHAPGQSIACPLQLRQREQARPATRVSIAARSAADGLVEGEGSGWRDMRERIGDDPRQLALHSRDLGAKRAPYILLCDWSSAIGDLWLLELGDHTRLLP